MIYIPQEQARDLSRSLKLEWLETNGLGGYAMGTVAGAHTRRYHGLLCAALRPPVERRMLLSKLEERVQLDGEEFALSCNVYRDVVHPAGHELLRGFRKDPWPVWTWELGPALVEKAVVMPHGRNATVVQYTCREADRPLILKVSLLVAFRDHHHLCRATVDAGFEVQPRHGGLQMTRGGGRALVLEFGDAAFWPCADWHYALVYAKEAERGLDSVEDLYCPGEIVWTLRPGSPVTLVASLDEPLGADPAEILEAERQRREGVMATASEGDQTARTLLLAADQFIVQRPDQGPAATSIIAGYPWFADWGRDTMIAFPGLLLATRRFTEARSVLLTYAAAMQDGLLPNLFAEDGQGAAYNTADATLWFFAACRRYYAATGDLTVFEETLFARMREALTAHIEGTLFDIHMDHDGLLWAGDETTQLTWMDAKVGDWVVTPRHGKAVEINALWYNAIRIAEFFARKLGRDARPYTPLARLVKESFVSAFWNAEAGCLYDCVRGEEKDASLRPNQVIALALPYAVLSVEQERSVLRVVTEKLLTPYGLRTLSPDDLRYRGRYQGDQWARDGAYHQGTVWPWLLEPYLSALLVLSGRSPEVRARVRALIAPLLEHLHGPGLGTLPEIFDGDAPHEPHGCPAQAWSVAALLRIWLSGDFAGS